MKPKRRDLRGAIGIFQSTSGDADLRISRHVVQQRINRAFAHQGDPKDPVAAAAGTFMLGTKGEATRAQAMGKELVK